ncbi:hypothetical protein PNEG_01052 [Pneumocystis murina B123]|uniref:DNA repair protein RAD50 n=1 Tax=Pneumocystis murina (strain B123) TaxID=1069680 RepID=M7NUX0_PNEMU|nr:hypothetical protein PNEG_01052 [Pneumocystis murina B123]EMR10906.1 hypothetical protein PNEG_01052 [Pneumocystis murina B123]
MSSIDKLSIMGIRSFDINVRETIQFYSPLTLIVGHNGSGKTTIIECLKYSTTGDLPPNSKGGAFIHDPNICGEKEVLAQVKLSFKNTNGAKMICTRSLQLLVKKTTRSQKTLDGQLTIFKDGERLALSNKCAELDTQIPISLGVSKAVLDYVIFCHQEDSNWPLSEPAVLKKRFDEIFEALRYTKALDQIKNLRKEQTTTIKIDEVTLEHYRSDKEKAEKIKKSLDKIVEKITITQAKANALDKQIQLNLSEQEELLRSGKKIEHIISEIERLKHEKLLLLNTLNDLGNNITHYEETSQELENMLENFGKKKENTLTVIDFKKKKHENLKKQLIFSRNELETSMSQEGKLLAKVETFQKLISKRQNLIKEVISNHKFINYGIDLTDQEMEALLKDILSKHNEQTIFLDNLKKENREKEGKLNEKLQELVFKENILEQKKTIARQNIRLSEKKIETIQNNLDTLSIDESEINILESTITDINEKIKNCNIEFQNSAWDEKIRQKKNDLRSLEEGISLLNEELAKGANKIEAQAKYEIIKEELNNKRHTLDILFKTNKEKIQNLIGNTINFNTKEQFIKDEYNKKKDELKELEKKYEITKQNLSEAKNKINIAKENLRNKTDQKNLYQIQIQEVCDPVNFLQTYEFKEFELNNISKYLSNLKHINDYFLESKAKVYEQNFCILCMRSFNDHEVSEFEKTIEKHIENIRNKESQLSESLKKAEEEMKNIKNTKIIFDAFQQLNNFEIPSQETKITDLENNIKELINYLEKNFQILKTGKKSLEELQSLKELDIEITHYQKEINNLTLSLKSAEENLQELGSSRTFQELQFELENFKSNKKKVDDELLLLQSKKEICKLQISENNVLYKDAQMKLNEAQYKLREKNDLVNKKNEVMEDISKFNKEIDETDINLKTLFPQISQLHKSLKEIREETMKKENQAQKYSNELQQNYNQLIDINLEIKTHKDSEKDLDLCREKISNIQKLNIELDEKISDITQEINDLEKAILDIRTTEKNIADNLRCRKIENEITKIIENISDLEKKNAEIDKEQYLLDSSKLKDKHEQLLTERASLLGEIKEMSNQLQNYEKELEEEYKDIHEQYRKQLIKTRTMAKINDDLQKYGKALDNAIMKYHSLKMEEINRIIDELWKKTYCGTDVDTILIRSDSENPKENRSYNYRVCMIKGDAELDMRGRCSAGQKVLASIIIRLALAECFGTNCGILALDEPTTNLDRENIQSLAISLANIIRQRRQQANFQLIIITHDEDFLRMMSCNDYCDYYYRISRNEQQKSVIERQRISEVI